MKDNLISPKQAAVILGCSYRRVMKMIELKMLPAVKLTGGSAWVLKEKDLENFKSTWKPQPQKTGRKPGKIIPENE